MKLILNLFKPVECKCGKGAGCCKNKKATKINELSSPNTNSPHSGCGCGCAAHKGLTNQASAV